MLDFRRAIFSVANRIHLAVVFCGLSAAFVICSPILAAEIPAQIDFARDVAPIFESHCLRCHNPENLKGDVSLATPQDLVEQEYLQASKPAESSLLELIAGHDGMPPKMPKEGRPLSAEQVAIITKWIETGATWPDGLVLKQKSKADKSWWAFQPLVEHPLPTSDKANPEWQNHPIDRFIFDALDKAELAPNPRADRRTLIRRATYDLIGLPPTPEETAAFVNDNAENAYEQLIDRLLASPRYGEHWGRHWLDVVRFGESNGFERNVTIEGLWPFRDYVIKSFNDDKPYDQLVREHLAGDVLAGDALGSSPELEIGTAFLVAGPYDNVGNQDAVQAAQIRANTIDEMVRTTSEAFLGLTVGCARCHNHKFDPILQADYHALQATFAGVRHGSRQVATPAEHTAYREKAGPLQIQITALNAEKARLMLALAADGNNVTLREQLAKIETQLAAVQQQLAAIPPLPNWWVGNFSPAPGPFHIFLGGDPQRRGEEIVPASLSVLEGIAPSYKLAADGPEAQRRLALANWIVDPANPLPPRVLANRLWHYHFGTGLLDTPSDFGYMGGRPTHPELLDYLAMQVHQNHWHLKPLHKLLMMSETYQQASTYRAAAAARDADSRLLWRFPPRRLAAEEVRDSMLAVAGKLDLKMGGPGFRLYKYVQDNVATYLPLEVHGPETYRRAVYHQNARAAVVDLVTDFDAPDCAAAAPRRAITTTPMQALTLLNHQFTLDMAQSLAERVQKEAGSEPAAQVRLVYQVLYSRDPTPEESSACQGLIAQTNLRALCRALLNTSEFLYVD